MASQVFAWAQIVNQAGKTIGAAFQVSPGVNVADFKKKVKEEKKPELDWLAADRLDVYPNKALYNNGQGQKMKGSASIVGLGVDDEDENVIWVVVPDAPAAATSGKFNAFTRLKSKGLTPYYFDRDSNNFGIVELNKVVKPSAFNKPKEVFLLTQDEYEKIKKLSDNIKEMVSLKLKQIELYKEYIPAVMQEIIKKNKSR
jgi:hypothetical protein